MLHIRRTLICCASLGAALFISASAKADPMTHDGFFLQMQVGLGYLTVAEDPPFDRTFSGVTVPSALYLGGSVTEGLVIGGGFFTDYAPAPSVSSGSVTLTPDNVGLYLIGLGPFVEIYPDPNDGFHIHAFVGWGGLEVTVNGNAGGSDPTGLILAAGAGYEWWVGDEWSIGAAGRLAYAPLSLNDIGYTAIAPVALATFTYH